MNKLRLTLLILLGTTSWAWGQISGSYISDGGSFAAFDGVNDHLQITPAELGTAFQFDGSFSMEVWVYREDWSDVPATNKSILSYTDFGGYALQLRSDDSLAFKVYSSTAGAYEYTKYPYTSLSAGWHHIAVVRITNPSAIHRLYIDGALVASSSGSGGTLSYEGDNYFEIGAESDGDSSPESGGYFEGAIDEVRIWDSLLDATEISDWMYKIITTSDRPTYYADLVGYYKLDTDWPSEYGGFMDDAADNVGGSGDYDLTGSDYTTDTAPRLIAGSYRLGNLDHLVWMDGSSSDGRLAVAYKQANDIDASASASLNSGAGFNPIGSATTRFSGSYDGDEYTISGLTIDTNLEIGMFFELYNAQVSDLTLSSLDFTSTSNYVGGLAGKATGTSTISNVIIVAGSGVTGSGYVGGLVGRCEDNVQISNSESHATVTGSISYVGGFIGESQGSVQITQCISTGSVSSSSSIIGGFIGRMLGGAYIKCYANGNVSGTQYVGGFSGYSYNATTSSISNSYCRGSVTGSSNYVGGFIGRNNGAEISDCYSTGSASGSANVGGFVGYHFGGSYSNSFWDEDASGLSTGSSLGSPTGIIGKTTVKMKILTTFTDETSEGLTTAWDFEADPFDDAASNEIWDMDVGLNNGYPELVWNIASGYSFATAVYSMIPHTVAQNSASSGGFVRTGSSITTRGVCWKTSSPPTISDSKTTDGSTTGNFTSSMTGLSSHTTYYVRAYVTDDGTTYYGEEFTIYPTHTVTEPVTDGGGVYQITSLENLGWISEDASRWSNNYAQTADIDASTTSTWFDNAGFLPIGDGATKFTGSYDGNGHTISHLTIDRFLDRQALFGYTDGASLTKIHLENLDINGDDYCGGLVGRANNSTSISKCIAEGVVAGDTYIGGLSGWFTDSDILCTCHDSGCNRWRIPWFWSQLTFCQSEL